VVPRSARVAVDGAFKTPSLRNVELTGPYFHNGRYATLDDALDFYQRGGNVKPLDPATHVVVNPLATAAGDDTSGTGGSNLDFAIQQIRLDAQDQTDLIAFLKALTDERVRWERAPFDHPGLALPNGADLPAVGAAGRAAVGLPPLRAYHEEARAEQQITAQP
jgi:hypothetical protein